MLIKEDDPLQYLYRNHKWLIDSMKTCYHSHSDGFNPYHLENDVLTHTLMVYNQLEKDASDELKMSALLHDIGKIMARNVVMKETGTKVTFYNHPAMSFYMAIPIVKDYCQKHFTEPDIKADRILSLIATHDNRKIEVVNPRMTNYYEYLALQSADIKGRITTKEIMVDNNDSELVIGKAIFQRKDKVVYMMIGCPASGKSTFLKDKEIQVLSRDSIMMELVNDENMDYNQTWKHCENNELHHVIDNMFNVRLETLLRGDCSFVIDKTNLVKSARKRLINQIKKVGNESFDICGVVMTEFGYTDIFINNGNREGKTLNGMVINNMMMSFTYPVLEEGFDYIFHSTTMNDQWGEW